MMWKRPNLDLLVTWKKAFRPARGANVACGIGGEWKQLFNLSKLLARHFNLREWGLKNVICISLPMNGYQSVKFFFFLNNQIANIIFSVL